MSAILSLSSSTYRPSLLALHHRASYPYPAVPVSGHPRGSRESDMQNAGCGLPRMRRSGSPVSEKAPSETVRKGILRQWLGRVPSMRRRAYQTDLSDAEWSHMEPLIPAPKAPGRPRVHTPREILNAIFFYIVRSGCAWRLLTSRLSSLSRPSIITSGDGVST